MVDQIDVNGPEYEYYYRDQVEDGLGGGADEKYLDYLTKTLLPAFDYKTAKVLDIGCSRFTTWDFFRDHFHNPITGCDIGREGLELCKREGKTGSIELDAHFLADYFPADSFDLILSFHALEHMVRVDLVAKHIHTILKPGGYAYLAVPSPSLFRGEQLPDGTRRSKGHHAFWANNAGFLAHFRKAGFDKVLHDEVSPACRFRPEQEAVCLLQK